MINGMPTYARLSILYLLSLALVSGCMDAPKTRPVANNSVTARQSSESATIACGDRVLIVIPNLNNPGVPYDSPQRVAGDGMISIPYIGPAKLAGMTCEEARIAIIESFRDANAACFGDPEVIVRRLP